MHLDASRLPVNILVDQTKGNRFVQYKPKSTTTRQNSGKKKRKSTESSAEASTAAKRQRQVDAEEDADSSQEQDAPLPKEWTAYIMISPPSSAPALRTRNKKAADSAPDIQKGPFFFTTDISWEAFLTSLSVTIRCRQDSLVIPSLKWKFDTPKSDTLKAVTGADGFKALKQAIAIKKNSHTIYIHMACPSSSAAAVVRSGYLFMESYARYMRFN